MKRLIIKSADKLHLKREVVGGKGYGLYRLKKHGLKVPEWATITSNFFNALIDSNSDLKISFDISKDIDSQCNMIKKSIENVQLDTKFGTLLQKSWKNISQNGKQKVAVRSSAADEDNPGFSFAGQFTTILEVGTYEKFLQSIKSCWLSAYEKRVIEYRMNNSLDPITKNFAVLVQKMVLDPDYSGVVFSANPIDSDRTVVVLNVIKGYGEALVAGETSASQYKISKITNKVKESQIENSVELSDAMLKRVFKQTIKIEKKFGLPVDIEFSIKQNKIFILQSRPITNLLPFKRDKNVLVWDNSNIVESYSGVTTPLTFSFIKKVYASVYKQFCEILGISDKQIEKNIDIFDNMLGLINGRVYYNLINWYKLVALLPGYKYNKEFMEQMMGLSEIRDYITIEEHTTFFKKYFYFLPKTMASGIKIINILLNLRKKITKFYKNFYKYYDQYKVIDFDSLSSADLLELVADLEENILSKWKEPILNDLKCMIFYGILKKVTVKWGCDPSGNIQNDLLAANENIKSKKVVTELLKISDEIKGSEDLSKLFKSNSEKVIYSQIKSDSRYMDFNKKFNEYLDVYGVRTFEEMKLESVPLKDNPLSCISILKNYLNNDLKSGGTEEYENSIRLNAQKVIKNKLKGKRFLLFFSKRSVYNWILKKTREGVQDRENQRFCRTEVYSIVRMMSLAMGKNLVESGMIDTKRDVFYLTWGELMDFVKGTAVSVDFKNLIKLRKNEFEKFEEVDSPDHIETQNEVYLDLQTNPDDEVSTEDKLSGTPCSRGIVENEVVVMKVADYTRDLHKQILVAKQTDPGWVVLFPSISGLIIEKGSMLSHSAIVAREMGIPTIVGVKNATRILQTGMRVKLNANSGEIKVVQG